MTARVTTLKGPDAGRYYIEALPSYYLDAGEPPGQWHGHGAEVLGLSGDVEAAGFLAVMAGLDPRTGVDLGRAFGEGSVRGFDVTCSAPKSVSLLWGLGDDTVRDAVVGAHDAAVGAVIDWVEAHAHTRYRRGRQVVVVDAEGIVAASFRQHTSRALDPQLHSHVVVANRVRSPDGRWLALDARTLKFDQRSLSALYHAGLRSELTRRLGVGWREPVNGIAEIAAVPEAVIELFSTRTHQIDARLEEKQARFFDSFGREPTPRERWRLEREAVVDSRPSKPHPADADTLHRSWVDQAAGAGHDPDRVVAAAVGRVLEPRVLGYDDVEAVVDAALGALAERQSYWRPAELVRELAGHVPTDIGLPAGALRSWLDELADAAAAARCLSLTPSPEPGVEVRRDGRPISESVLDSSLTTPAIVAEEERIEAWAHTRLQNPVEVVPLPDDTVAGLSPLQHQAAAAVAGGAPLVLIVGPGGSGKTTALAAAVSHLQRHRRVAFGVAPSAAAAEVLAESCGIPADTLDKLLVEHRLDRAPEPLYDLPHGATVVVDEAAMVPTAKLAELAALADREGWRVVLVGDPLQFSAVGRGGMFGHLVAAHDAIELGRPRRFDQPWEADASLRVRSGDPTAGHDYAAHGRIHGANPARIRARLLADWSDAAAQGESVLMLAPTNDTVAALNRLAQQLRHHRGDIDLSGPATTASDKSRLVAGDVIAARRNDRSLRTHRGEMIRNRDTFTIAAVHDDGSLAVSGRTGHAHLPASYVADHVELAYAQTSHAAQGRTVDRSLLLLDTPTDTAGIYVPITRGRAANHIYVPTDHADHDPVDVVADAIARRWTELPAVARRDELHPTPARDPNRPTPLDPAVLRVLLQRHHHLADELSRLRYDADHASRQLANNQQRQQHIQANIAAARERLHHANGKIARLQRPARRLRAHNRQELDTWRGTAATAQDAIARGGEELDRLTAEQPRLAEQLVDAHDDIRRHGPALQVARADTATKLNDDLHARATAIAADPLQPLTGHAQTLTGPAAQSLTGHTPTSLAGEAEPDLYPNAVPSWALDAARIDQHQTAWDIAPTEPLGHRPAWNDSPAYRTSYQAAADAATRLAPSHGLEPEAQGIDLSL